MQSPSAMLSRTVAQWPVARRHICRENTLLAAVSPRSQLTTALLPRRSCTRGWPGGLGTWDTVSRAWELRLPSSVARMQ